MTVSGEAMAPRTRVLYLLTDEISSVLVRGQLGYLVGESFDVTVAARRAAAGAPPEPGKWDPNVHVEHVPFVREPSPVADLRALWATIRLISRLRPTIVNASTPKAGLLGMLAARFCRVPVRVYVVRGFRFETATGWRRRLFRWLEWVAMSCATHVLFNSRSLMALGRRERLIRSGRGGVIGGGSGNGIDVVRFADDALPTRTHARAQLGLPAAATVIGYVGRFTTDKGIADLVEAFAGGIDVRPDRWLLLVGQFEDGDALDANVRTTIEDHDRIVVVGWLDHPGVAYRAMDVLAFPSYREGLPNVPLEAQLCGIPVVGYAATGTVDAVLDGFGAIQSERQARCGELVPVGDRAGLRAALGRTLVDLGSHHEHGERSRQWVVDTFEQHRYWARLAEVYAAALDALSTR